MPFRRIVYIHNGTMPTRAANNVHAMRMCQAFQRAGYQTTLFAPKAPASEPDIQDVWTHFHIDTPFELRFLPHLPVLRKYDVGLRAALSARFTRDTLVYARYMPGAAIAAHLGIPAMYEAHGPQTNPTVLRVLLRHPRMLRFVTTTHAIKDHYLTTFAGDLKPEKVVVEPDAVDLTPYMNGESHEAARRAINLPARRFTAVYVGHLYAGRGIELIVELSRLLPEVHFLIVGGTEEDIAHWRGQAHDQSLDNLEFTGFVRNADVPLYLSAADVLLMPYQHNVSVYKGDINTARWMSPMKMFEYMAASRPIISSDLPVLREILNEHNAILCAPESADDWQAALRRLQEDTTLAEKLARQARQDVGEYTWDKRVERIINSVSL